MLIHLSREWVSAVWENQSRCQPTTAISLIVLISNTDILKAFMDWGGTLSEYWSADVYLREELVFLEENYDNHNEDTANESYTKLNSVVSQKETHGRCTLWGHLRRKWALFYSVPYSSMKSDHNHLITNYICIYYSVLKQWKTCRSRIVSPLVLLMTDQVVSLKTVETHSKST